MNMIIEHTRSALDSEMESFCFLGRGATLSPFIGDDTSVGMEYELQVAVEGEQKNVDLPMAICGSTFYKNVVKRTERGDLSSGCLEALHQFLHDSKENIWENSWVQLPEYLLSDWTRKILARDFLEDKSSKSAKKRGDLNRFRCKREGEEWLRVPISYLLKLSLADVISRDEDIPEPIFTTGKNLLDNFVSDNTSPEILSFTIPRASGNRIGDLAASETARTFLISQLLIQYSNVSFGLKDSGQKCLLYFAPHAPTRQKRLNEIVPDNFYRHLFMSPCLSGWDRGEEKHQYMEVCHKVLSRSQLNTISKLKDAGIITNNLITLPNTSNTCLANNGTHVSLGSRVLTQMAGDPGSGFSPSVEKYLGDLVIKIVEHFLPLFVGVYSAAPYRLDFCDFHPENVLGFLPHELDYTHLRMVWRRWKKKAKLGFLGRSFTPFGPKLLDNTIASVLRLKGDLVPDFRLIDYFVSTLSTDTSPGLDGSMGNHERLKEELTEMGVFDSKMSIYLLYRQRLAAHSGYAGFEGRSYSLFHTIREDMAEAVDMQNLITALAYRYIFDERVTHHDIPDSPSIESERRQIFFGSAIGIPTFFIRANTKNRFLQRIVSNIPSVRNSNRYRGYLRVKQQDYKLSLLRILEKDGKQIISEMGLRSRLENLRDKLEGRKGTALTKILRGVRSELPGTRAPLNLGADTYNGNQERFFRNDLKRKHITEGLEILKEDCEKFSLDPLLRELVQNNANNLSPSEFIELQRENVLSETADNTTLKKLLQICLAIVYRQQQLHMVSS